MDNEKKFVLELNEKQLRLIKDALEEYFRIRMNQWLPLADSLASKNVDFSQDNPNHDAIFDDYIKRRDHVGIVLAAAGNILWRYGNNPKTQEQLMAEDIWQVIRYTLWNENHKSGEDSWCVDSKPPINWSDEPLPQCIVKNP